MEGRLQKALGINVKAVRLKMGLSQEAFAEHLGVHRTYASSIERGERNLSLRSVERLAEVLGIEPLDLLISPPGAERKRRPQRDR